MSDACPRCGMDHEQVRDLCRRSLLATAQILCGYQKGPEHEKEPSPEFHGRVCEWYEQKIAAGCRRLLLMKPRGHLKTSIFTLANIVWMLIRNPNERILVVHASSDKTAEWLQALESYLQAGEDDDYHNFRHFFPELVPDTRKVRWNSTGFEINRQGVYAEPSVTALGLKSTVTGGKFTTIILDDLVDEIVANSPETIQKALNYLKRVRFLLADQHKGLVLVVGTFWPGGFYEDLLKRKHFDKLILGCYHDHRSLALWPSAVVGTPLWPEEFTVQSLEESREETGEYEFSHQMLNIPVDIGMQRFDQSDMMYYYPDANYDRLTFETDRGPGFVLKEDLSVQMTIDPSTGEGDDESAIAVSAWHKETSKAFVLEAWSGRVLPEGLTNRIFEIYAKWELLGLRPLGVAIEEQGFQKTYKHWLRNESMRRGVHLPIRDDIRPESRSKSSRIVDGLQPFVKRHQVYFTKEHLRLVRQLVDYHPGRLDQRDDLVDALAYQVRFWSYAPREAYRDEFAEVPIHDEDQSDERWYGLECAA